MKKYAINILVILFLLTPFTLFANGCHANNDTIKVLAIGNSFFTRCSRAIFARTGRS